jgi:hypothetical protein
MFEGACFRVIQRLLYPGIPLVRLALARGQ